MCLTLNECASLRLQGWEGSPWQPTFWILRNVKELSFPLRFSPSYEFQHFVSCRVGDAVFGQAAGCLGSAVLCSGHALVAKPPNVSFTEASTIPTVFLTAYSCLHDEAGIHTKSRVLVHAATGETLNLRDADMLRPGSRWLPFWAVYRNANITDDGCVPFSFLGRAR